MGPGGGMMMGPGHPYFADRARHPPMGPLGPSREDFDGQGPRRGGRGGGNVHPGIMPLGPGRGTDPDSMFG
eukprot:gene25032-10678_t